VVISFHVLIAFNAPPHSWKISNSSPRVETSEEEGIGVLSLACSTLGVEGCAGASRWGLG